MINALTSALSGLNTAARQVQNSANNIANATTPGIGENVNFAEEAVTLILSEAAYKANIKTIEATQELTDELLSLFDETV